MEQLARFVLVDVFTAKPFGGNQLAVYYDARELAAAEMQSLARELNFSESTFVTREDPARPPRVRIFTPQREIPMAGHPTVGTAWVLAARGEIPLGEPVTETALELGIGTVPITIESRDGAPAFVWMAHREPSFGTIRRDRARVARALGIGANDIRRDLPMQPVSTGNSFLFVPIANRDALERCAPNGAALRAIFQNDLEMLPVHMFVAPDSPGTPVRARMFAPHTDGIPEDPATGSAAAPLGAYLVAHGAIAAAPAAAFTVAQGIEIGRPSEIRVEVRRNEDGAFAIRIGGQAAIAGEGALRT
jgi:trans-2,3-dihydro-3-hydroxyanthranilate isomerase